MDAQTQGSGSGRRAGLAAINRDKRKVAGYVIGLLLIAVAITCSHLIIDYLIARNKQDQQTIHLGYQQNILAQRINQLAYRYILASRGYEAGVTRELLREAVDEMYRLHLGLLHHPPSAEYAAAADAIYFDARHELDLKIRTYLSAARELAEKPADLLTPSSPLARFLQRHNSEALQQGLNLALERYKTADDQAVQQLRIILWGLFLAVLLVLILEWRFVFHPIFYGLLKRADDYRNQAHTDPLTGCFNRRRFMLAADETFQSIQQTSKSCTLLMLDIDRFKWINDHFGHCTGDEVIQALVDSCLGNLRKNDVFGRLGGEEFAVMLRDTTLDQAERVAESLRQKVKALDVAQYDSETRVSFTVSIGVTSMLSCDRSPMDAIHRADIALYQAKAEGRNRVVVSTHEQGAAPAGDLDRLSAFSA